MNGLYSWSQDEIIIAERRKDIQREVEQNRLLCEAGLSKPPLNEHMAIALGNLLVKMGERLQKKYTHPHQVYQAAGGRSAM